MKYNKKRTSVYNRRRRTNRKTRKYKTKTMFIEKERIRELNLRREVNNLEVKLILD